MTSKKIQTRKLIIITGIVLAVILHTARIECRAVCIEQVQLLIDRDYFPAALSLLRSAKKSIRVMMFEASYYTEHPGSASNQLIDELIAAKKRGLTVEVILEVKDKKDRTTLRNLETARKLRTAGVDVSVDAKDIVTHGKLVLIDDEKAILGSTNWTYNALSKNHEVSVLLSAKESIKELCDYFQAMKSSATKF